MRTFSKFIFICNLCFVASFIMRFVNLGHSKSNLSMDVVEVHPLESSIVVLGFAALFFNVLYFILIFVNTIRKVPGTWRQWLLYLNIFIFLLELIFWFY